MLLVSSVGCFLCVLKSKRYSFLGVRNWFKYGRHQPLSHFAEECNAELPVSCYTQFEFVAEFLNTARGVRPVVTHNEFCHLSLDLL